MSHDLSFPAHETRINYTQPGMPRPQISVAASSASFPGCRTRVLHTLDTTALGDFDRFTHQNKVHVLMRFYPGDEPPRPLPHRRATAEIPTTCGIVVIPVEITAGTPALVQVTWIDETGEIIGTWCPTSMVKLEHDLRD